jgi:hypothetical protein
MFQKVEKENAPGVMGDAFSVKLALAVSRRSACAIPVRAS